MKKAIMVSLVILLALSIGCAFNVSTSSYTVESYHFGSAGNNETTSSYNSRSTTTYEQGSNPDGQTSSYTFNSGWFGPSYVCGDGYCENITLENCENCPEDCGACVYPTPAGPTIGSGYTFIGLKQCEDNIDNDEDGFIDFPEDEGCESLKDNDETTVLLEEELEELEEVEIIIAQFLGLEWYYWLIIITILSILFFYYNG